ncbi:MAG: hypothetical protein A2W25_04680 [candidate division Zixibacteria bacterium RBG_16_53_22]|nr:MAG: hypothetical protein A2W25_04680 [candidate division Zixibacteria bacterium RBG_16_53_22]
MWPLIIAAGVYMVCKGIQDGIDSNRGRNQKILPPHAGDDSIGYLTRDDRDLLIDDNLNGDRYGR